MMAMFGDECKYCGIKVTIDTAEMDHFIPRSEYKHNNFNLMVVACKPCNQAKGTFWNYDIEIIKEYIFNKRGITMPIVQSEFHVNAQVDEILLPKVQNASLVAAQKAQAILDAMYGKENKQ